MAREQQDFILSHHGRLYARGGYTDEKRKQRYIVLLKSFLRTIAGLLVLMTGAAFLSMPARAQEAATP